MGKTYRHQDTWDYIHTNKKVDVYKNKIKKHFFREEEPDIYMDNKVFKHKKRLKDDY